MIIRGTQVLTIVPSRNENTLLLKTQNNYTHIKLFESSAPKSSGHLQGPVQEGEEHPGNYRTRLSSVTTGSLASSYLQILVMDTTGGTWI
jgi:hypothetical protein